MGFSFKRESFPRKGISMVYVATIVVYLVILLIVVSVLGKRPDDSKWQPFFESEK